MDNGSNGKQCISQRSKYHYSSSDEEELVRTNKTNDNAEVSSDDSDDDSLSSTDSDSTGIEESSKLDEDGDKSTEGFQTSGEPDRKLKSRNSASDSENEFQIKSKVNNKDHNRGHRPTDSDSSSNESASDGSSDEDFDNQDESGKESEARSNSTCDDVPKNSKFKNNIKIQFDKSNSESDYDSESHTTSDENSHYTDESGEELEKWNQSKQKLKKNGPLAKVASKLVSDNNQSDETSNSTEKSNESTDDTGELSDSEPNTNLNVTKKACKLDTGKKSKVEGTDDTGELSDSDPNTNLNVTKKACKIVTGKKSKQYSSSDLSNKDSENTDESDEDSENTDESDEDSENTDESDDDSESSNDPSEYFKERNQCKRSGKAKKLENHGKIELQKNLQSQIPSKSQINSKFSPDGSSDDDSESSEGECTKNSGFRTKSSKELLKKDVLEEDSEDTDVSVADEKANDTRKTLVKIHKEKNSGKEDYIDKKDMPSCNFTDRDSKTNKSRCTKPAVAVANQNLKPSTQVVEVRTESSSEISDEPKVKKSNPIKQKLKKQKPTKVCNSKMKNCQNKKISGKGGLHVTEAKPSTSKQSKLKNQSEKKEKLISDTVKDLQHIPITPPPPPPPQPRQPICSEDIKVTKCVTQKKNTGHQVNSLKSNCMGNLCDEIKKFKFKKSSQIEGSKTSTVRPSSPVKTMDIETIPTGDSSTTVENRQREGEDTSGIKTTKTEIVQEKENFEQKDCPDANSIPITKNGNNSVASNVLINNDEPVLTQEDKNTLDLHTRLMKELLLLRGSHLRSGSHRKIMVKVPDLTSILKDTIAQHYKAKNGDSESEDSAIDNDDWEQNEALEQPEKTQF